MDIFKLWQFLKTYLPIMNCNIFPKKRRREKQIPSPMDKSHHRAILDFQQTTSICEHIHVQTVLGHCEGTVCEVTEEGVSFSEKCDKINFHIKFTFAKHISFQISG